MEVNVCLTSWGDRNVVAAVYAVVCVRHEMLKEVNIHISIALYGHRKVIMTNTDLVVGAYEFNRAAVFVNNKEFVSFEWHARFEECSYKFVVQH